MTIGTNTILSLVSVHYLTDTNPIEYVGLTALFSENSISIDHGTCEVFWCGHKKQSSPVDDTCLLACTLKFRGTVRRDSSVNNIQWTGVVVGMIYRARSKFSISVLIAHINHPNVFSYFYSVVWCPTCQIVNREELYHECRDSQWLGENSLVD